MLTIKRAKIFDIIKLNKMLNKLKFDKSFLDSLDFYSEYTENLYLQIIFGNVYFVIDKKNIYGFIIFNKKESKLYFIPGNNKISLFKFLHLIKRSIGFYGLNISLNYKNIDILFIKKYFSLKITDNLMFMSIDNGFRNDIIVDSKTILIRKLIINKEEALRVELQNKIFSNIRNRMPLTLNDILYEESSSRFLNDLCFVFEEFRVPVGYGQILKFNNHYFLVNFGIVEEYQKRGYGYYFLNYILKECYMKGIKTLYLSVDKNNNSAINLYNKIGFKEVRNSITLEFQ